MSRVLLPVAQMPGFPQVQILNLEPVEGAWGLYTLLSPQVPELRLFVLDCAVHLPQYTPRFSSEQLALVGDPAQGERTVLAVVNTAGGEPTVNLLAPLLVNSETGSCAQLILDSQGWPLRHVLQL
ncbi:flagellar assembly protein FliW [Glutamicibacter creatinolyticus]|uniref:flagellar assembly protein FliW n=1 Tax=Glutamicibacter creatinolyticus TaxID=162496 RepID=UPI003D2F20B9